MLVMMIIATVTLVTSKCGGFPSNELGMKLLLEGKSGERFWHQDVKESIKAAEDENQIRPSPDNLPINLLENAKQLLLSPNLDQTTFDANKIIANLESSSAFRRSLATSPTRVSFQRDKKSKFSNKINIHTNLNKTSNFPSSDVKNKATDEELASVLLNWSSRNDSEEPTENHSVKLDAIENELVRSKEKSNHDLLLAISILQHHMFPHFQDSKEEKKPNVHEKVKFEKSSNFINSKIPEINVKVAEKKEKVESDIIKDGSITKDQLISADLKRKLKNVNSGYYRIKSLSHLHWFVLVMEGDCSLIRHRMSAFVTFLKAALSTKLSASYEDIYVPSVYCDKRFLVNISLDVQKYPSAEVTLQTLAQANTTLLEISGEIFYLENILTQKSPEGSASFFNREADVEIVIYIAIGCMCVFILLSLVTVALIKICRQEANGYDLDKLEPIMKISFPIRKPNVIYSTNFSQSLNPEKCHLNNCEDPMAQSEGITPCSSSRSRGGESFERGEIDSSTRGSRTKLIEEEDEEDEIIDEDYQEDDEEEDEEEEEYDEEDDDVEELPRVIRTSAQKMIFTETEPLPRISFDNPCYGR